MASKNVRHPPQTLVVASGFRGILRVLEGPNPKGEYLLEYGSLTIWVHEAKLSIASESKAKKSKSRKRKEREPTTKESKSSRIDLHGLTVDDATAELEKAIDAALRHNCFQIEVIHGIGTGAVKDAVHRYLAKSRHVERFQLDPKNAGTTWVYL